MFFAKIMILRVRQRYFYMKKKSRLDSGEIFLAIIKCLLFYKFSRVQLTCDESHVMLLPCFSNSLFIKLAIFLFFELSAKKSLKSNNKNFFHPKFLIIYCVSRDVLSLMARCSSSRLVTMR